MVSAICPVTSRLNVSAWILTASGPRSARIWDAWAKRKSPVRMATELFHWELTYGWPRRTRASSMTSSWNSVARWVSSIATAASMTRGSFGSPNCAASSTSMARKRLPPAAMECWDAWVSSSSSGCAVTASDSSTRIRSSSTSASRVESGKSTGTAVINCSPRHRHARTPRTSEYARSALDRPGPGAAQAIRRGAAQHADDHQRRLARGDRGLEDGELPGESAGQRYAREGQQEQREDARHQRRRAAQAGPAGQVPGLAAGVAHQGDHRECAHRGETVGGQVEQAA